MTIDKYQTFMNKLGITEEDVEGLTEAKTINYIHIAATVTVAERLSELLKLLKDRQCTKQPITPAKQDKKVKSTPPVDADKPKAKVVNTPAMPPSKPLDSGSVSNSGGTSNQILSAGKTSPLGKEKLGKAKVDTTIPNAKLGFPDAHSFQQHARQEKMASEKKLRESHKEPETDKSMPQPNSNLVPGNIPVPSQNNAPINQPPQYAMPKQQQTPPVQGQQTNPVPQKNDQRGISFT